MLFKKNRDPKVNKPVLKLEMDPADWILEILAIVGLLCFLGFMIYQYANLPDTIPTHFNSEGKPDSYGSKKDMWLFPAVALVLYAILTLISRIPEKLNYFVKITQSNARIQYLLVIRLIRYLKLTMVLILFYIGYKSVMISLHHSNTIGTWFLPVYISVILIPIIIYIILSLRNR